MARMPTPTADPAAAASTDTDAASGTDMDAGDMGDTDTTPTVLVTIAQGPDGGYIVYSGDEPEEGAGDDDSAMGAGGAGPAADAGGGAAGGGMGAPDEASAGQQVDSIGAALKAAMDILNESASGAGSSEEGFAAGFDGDQSPTPASGGRGRLKYPPAAAG
jgi:hypothetical protein